MGNDNLLDGRLKRPLSDKELGRWCDPNNPFRVCYPRTADRVTVIDERLGQKGDWDRKRVGDVRNATDFGYSTAKRFFEAHPEPKPWHNAKPGEVWILTLDNGKETPQVVDYYGDFQPWHQPVKTDGDSEYTITTGRRIYPKED